MDEEEEDCELPGSSGNVSDRCGQGQECGSRARVGLGLQQALWVTTTRNPPCGERRAGASSHRAPASALELKTCVFTSWW